MSTTTRPGDKIQRWYCSDCECEHEASVMGGLVMPALLPERGTRLQSLREVESTRVEEENYNNAPSKQESRREVAERIAEAHVNWPQGYKAFARAVAAIEAALEARDKRAAKIAETAFKEFQTGYNAGKWIAAAIRNGDTNGE